MNNDALTQTRPLPFIQKFEQTQQDKDRAEANRQQWLKEARQAVAAMPAADQDEFYEYISARMPRCRATRKVAFQRWMVKQLEHVNCPCDFSSDDFLRALYAVKPPANVSKRDREQMINGHVVLIKMGEEPDGTAIIWKVPNTPEMMAFINEHWDDLAIERISDSTREAWDETLAPYTGRQSSPRYQIMKKYSGGKMPLHRLWVPVEIDDHVLASDGDFLNWTTVIRKTVTQPKATADGLAWTTGKLADSGYKQVDIIEIPNLYPASSDLNPAKAARQEKFEKAAMRQYKVVKDEEHHEEVLIDAAPAKIHANADLGKRTGTYGGRIVDCGHSRALSARERIDMGLQHDYHDVTLKAAIEGDEPTDKQRNDEALKAESVVPVHRYKADLDWNGRGVFRAENFITYAVNNLCFSFAPSCLFMTVIVETGKLT